MRRACPPIWRISFSCAGQAVRRQVSRSPGVGSYSVTPCVGSTFISAATDSRAATRVAVAPPSPSA